jgi:hypothetical protein
VFFSYRWLSWLIAAAAILWQRTLVQHGMLLVITFALNVLATAIAQPYVRVARRNPPLMAFDVLLMALALLIGGGWMGGAFGLHAMSSLVLPALLFSWRGGLMAGLAFVTANLAATWAVLPRSPTQFLESGRAGQFELLLIMGLPPLFGVVFPWTVELLRRVADRHQARNGGRRASAAGPRRNRDTRPDPISRYMPGGRDADGGRESDTLEAALPALTATARATEQGVEDLRRTLSAPFPNTDLDLPATLELLASRFGRHTGATTRVTLLGRTRLVHHAHRAVLVRLAQEALLNIQQHAHASLIELTLRYDAHSVALLIQDDGVGLLDGTYERPGWHMLRVMYYRLAELGGRLDIFETEGGGVTVRATMPLE